ncbi:MAG: FkbM family methyltransferase [Pseudomonadota bacterium]|nr:FkbM family methyltransferase [Pseudomonadota bacterium]
MTPESAWHPSDGSAGLIIDLGANRGEFALAAARFNPDLDVLAIEPIPSLAEFIVNQARSENLTKVRCLELAVDDVGGQAELNVQSSHDQGVSSLLTFDRRSLQDDDYWRGRVDLAFDAAIPVTVRRLDEVLPANPPPIRFVKIDVQGRDIQALRSFGRHLERVDGGMLEIPGTLANRLYEAEIFDLGTAIAEVRGMGFEVHAVKPNDPAGNEYNLFFHRRGSDWRHMEEHLGLRRIPLYGGRHFWHLPSDHLRHPEAELASLFARVIAAEEQVVDWQGRSRAMQLSLDAVAEKITETRRAVDEALASADTVRRVNAELQDRLAAAEASMQLQQQRCVLLEAEKAALRRSAAPHLAEVVG